MILNDMIGDHTDEQINQETINVDLSLKAITELIDRDIRFSSINMEEQYGSSQ